jgi:hypothetical protein
MRGILAAFAITGIMFVTPAKAAGWCSGTATNALTYSNGDFMARVSWRNDWVKICSLTQAYGDVSPQTCFAWFSVINNSMSYDKTLTLYYSSITDADCATMPTYGAAPVPGYVMMNR